LFEAFCLKSNIFLISLSGIGGKGTFPFTSLNTTVLESLGSLSRQLIGNIYTLQAGVNRISLFISNLTQSVERPSFPPFLSYCKWITLHLCIFQ